MIVSSMAVEWAAGLVGAPVNRLWDSEEVAGLIAVGVDMSEGAVAAAAGPAAVVVVAAEGAVVVVAAAAAEEALGTARLPCHK